jgi:hypothetical protein
VERGLGVGCSKLFLSRCSGASSGREAETYCKQLRQKGEEGSFLDILRGYGLGWFESLPYARSASTPLTANRAPTASRPP